MGMGKALGTREEERLLGLATLLRMATRPGIGGADMAARVYSGRADKGAGVNSPWW
jgi:hypothetical protein